MMTTEPENEPLHLERTNRARTKSEPLVDISCFRRRHALSRNGMRLTYLPAYQSITIQLSTKKK